MNTYSQNGEDLLIQNYFGDYIGTVLSIGENDGVTYSNALALIEKGWGAVLVEPSMKVFPKLKEIHHNNDKVHVLNVAIGDDLEETTLYDSGDFLIKGTCSLLSTCKPSEIKRWGDVTFEETTCKMISFQNLRENSYHKTYDFITIDCEGYDLYVLKQIDLNAVGCRCICIEHNSFPEVLQQMKDYIYGFGFREVGYNAENIICVK
jgi:FkbM family methyltransferase